MYKLLTLMMISIYMSGCTALNNPFKEKTSSMTSFCKLELNKRIELERMSFKLPKPISGVKPCQAGKELHSMQQDKKIFFSRILSFENNVYSSLGSMDLRVKGNLNFIGNKIETPTQWLARHKVMWKGSYRDDRPVRRIIKRIKLKGRDCIRIYKTSLVRKYSRGERSPVKPTLIGYDIEYICWDAKEKTYPPFAITAGVGYEKGKTTFPYDMDKDILLPVFNSLKLKKLSNQKMEERLEERREEIAEDCRFMISSVEDFKYNKSYENISIRYMKILKDCGYEKYSSLKKWWCKETIRDSKGDKKRSQYKFYQKDLKENLKACQK